MAPFGRKSRTGKRIKKSRAVRGLTQEQLARHIGISRPAVSDIENGKREVKTSELTKIAEALNTSIDYLLGLEKEPEVVLGQMKKRRKTESSVRISVPQKKLEKFKEVFLYILNKVGSKPNVGETVIYKLLYFIDFNFYEKYEEQLIGATYQKNKFGPTPVEFLQITKQMIKNKEIVKLEKKYFSYPQTKYLPLRVPDLSILTAHEKDVIDDVLSKLSDMTGKKISEYSHGDIPWQATRDGEFMEYETVFYRTPQYSVREYEDE